MNRRGFLAGILAVGVPPLIIPSGALALVAPRSQVITYVPYFVLTPTVQAINGPIEIVTYDRVLTVEEEHRMHSYLFQTYAVQGR